MRLTTWNVNGIRNPFSYQPWNTARTFPAMFDILEADIVVMQELKIQRKDLRDDMVMLDGWDCYFSLPKHKKGYSGVGIYTRNATCSPIRAEEGLLGVLAGPNSGVAYRDLSESEHIGGYPSDLQIAELGVDPALLDAEGRCVCLEFPAFVLFGIYSPANSNGLRDDFRYGFLCALDCRIRNLRKIGKRVVLVGDLNVSRDEHDTAGAIEELRKTGITHDEYVSTPNRRVFNQLIVGGEVIGERDEGREQPVLVDVVREFHPLRKGMYTHWEQKVNARPGNFGSRIDFVLPSTDMREWFSHANIQEGLMGSDHCPVFGDFKSMVPMKDDHGEQEVHLLDIMNPPGVFLGGTRQKPWNVKDVPAYSAKLMPEFYQRRSIKDMFTKKPSVPSRSNTDMTPTQPLASPKRPQSPSSNGLTAPVSQGSPDWTPNRSSDQPMDRKRSIADAPGSKPSKKQKVTSLTTPKATGPPKGQQSLKGFFQPKSGTRDAQRADPKAATTATVEDLEAEMLPTSIQEGFTAHDTVAGRKPADNLLSRDGVSTSQVPSSPSAADREQPLSPAPTSNTFKSPQSEATWEDDTVHDPIVSKESWGKLFSKPRAPLCEGHEEPCKSMLTKKKGENQGRSFWMCARPLGPSGNKEKGTQWRCGTFIWCSDLKGG